MDDIKILREQSGMSRNEFCDRFGIPYRTLQDWELGNRKCPDYVIKLIQFRLDHDQQK